MNGRCKKFIAVAAMLVMIAAASVCLTGCGGSPLSKAYKHLSNLAESGGFAEEYQTFAEAYQNDDPSAEPALEVTYNEEKDALSLYFDWKMDLDGVFEILEKDLGGKDIGTLSFFMLYTNGEDFEAKLNAKMAELECGSMEMLGVNFNITDSNVTDHGWTKLAEKTTALFITNKYGVADIASYSEEEQARLDNITRVDISADIEDETFYSYKYLKNLETIAIVDPSPYYLTEDEREAQKATESDADDSSTTENSTDGTTTDSTATDGTATDSTATDEIVDYSEATTDESGESGDEAEESTALDFTFGEYSYGVSSTSAKDMLAFAEMGNLKQVLIYPDTGYTLTNSGAEFVTALRYIVPEMQINEPGVAYDGGATVAVTEVDTSVLTESEQRDIFETLLELEIKDVYDKCKGFKTKSSAAKINGKVLAYEADPWDEWSSKRVYSSSGTCNLVDVADAGYAIPEKIGDYSTFVYIYPTYVRTGVYTSGTKAYKKTLNVQVFDLENEIAYAAKSVDSASAPQQFSYYGSAPDKKSGETETSKAYKYLKKLDTL